MFVQNKIKPHQSDYFGPPGCNPLRDEDRMPILKVVSGDTWTVDANLVSACGAPANLENSYVEFILAQNQFLPPLWKGEWMSGVKPDKNRPGLVHVLIPRDVTKMLRSGTYMFSLRVSDKMRYSYDTQLVGNFLVEYMPTSDQHSIPYRDGTSEIFGRGGCCNKDKEDREDREDGNVMVRNVDTGLYHKLVAVDSKGPNGKVVRLSLSQKGQSR